MKAKSSKTSKRNEKIGVGSFKEPLCSSKSASAAENASVSVFLNPRLRLKKNKWYVSKLVTDLKT